MPDDTTAPRRGPDERLDRSEVERLTASLDQVQREFLEHLRVCPRASEDQITRIEGRISDREASR